MIDTLNADWGGVVPGNNPKVPTSADDFINTQHMTRFIFRNPLVQNPVQDKGNGNCGEGTMAAFSACEVTPLQAAQYTNAIQEMMEKTTHGIPAVFKSNARNHLDPSAKAGINVSAGSFSTWPKEAGLAATRDMELINKFANIMQQEWSAVGIRAMYGYMMDLATEPRWYRVHETFTEDADLASDIMKALITGLQKEHLGKDSIALTIKHFPGGGPQLDGMDPHYSYGKEQTYPGNMFDYHLKPFKAAIDAGASSIMPYYGIPVDQRISPNDVGMSFSKGVVSDLLRDEMGFKGYVNTDTGIIADRAWSTRDHEKLEDESEAHNIAMAIAAGADVLSGYNDKATIMTALNKEFEDAWGTQFIDEARVDLSVKRLLKEQFDLGLFENPYVDESKVANIIGNSEFQALADEAQKKSVVLLKNETLATTEPVLPLKTDAQSHTKIYTLGVDSAAWANSDYDVTEGDKTIGTDDADTLSSYNYALIRVRVKNEKFVSGKDSEEMRIFGGAAKDEVQYLSFTDMAKHDVQEGCAPVNGADQCSWKIEPKLSDIKKVIESVGADKVILSVNFRQPFVLDEASHMKDAAAILGTFGVSDANLMSVLTGETAPQGKLPFALATSAEAIARQKSDVPGYPFPGDTLFPFGHGLTYK